MRRCLPSTHHCFQQLENYVTYTFLKKNILLAMKLGTINCHLSQCISSVWFTFMNPTFWIKSVYCIITLCFIKMYYNYRTKNRSLLRSRCFAEANIRACSGTGSSAIRFFFFFLSAICLHKASFTSTHTHKSSSLLSSGSGWEHQIKASPLTVKLLFHGHKRLLSWGVAEESGQYV